MAEHVSRLPFSLEPLMAEAKRRARQRRFLVAVIALVLIGGAVGAAVAFRSPQGPGSSPPLASNGGTASTNGTSLAAFPRYGLSFRYPAGWRRFDCRYATSTTMSVTFLTTTRERPRCTPGGVMPARLGKHGVSVLWQQIALFKVVPNTRIGGQPAHVEVVNADASGRGWCSALGGQRVIEAAIQEPATANTWFAVATCLRGPKLAASHAAVNQMLASVRFRTRTTTP